MELRIEFNKYGIEISYDILNSRFSSDYSNVDAIRYIKGILETRENFIQKFINHIKSAGKDIPDFNLPEKTYENWLEIFDNVKPFSYKECFEIKDESFRIKVFGTVNIDDMINNLGAKRIATDGKSVKHKQFDNNGNFIGYKEYDNIYEVYEVNCEKLGLEEPSYALKCWCTSTNKEHWLWIEDKYKNDPLAAVSSTFRIHENLIPYIKEIKRQGDILLVEMKEEVEPKGNIVPLTSDQYFGFLTAQS